MDVDDEDPAWLEACMAVVDSLPAANLQSTSNQGTATAVLPAIAVGSNRNGSPRSSHDGGGGRSSTAAAAVAPFSREARSNSHVASRNAAGVAPFGTGGGAAGASTTAGSHRSNSSIAGSARPGAPPSWANGGRRRMRGVGAHPDDDVRGAQDRGVPDSLDPCGRCGEAVRFMEFGNNQFFGCSSHPLCKATRKTRKNGAVVELIAEETRPDADAASSSGERLASVLEEADPTGINRCHLCVKVRGGHVGGAAQAAWQLLRRNGIVPTREHGGAANGGRGGISNNGTNAGGVSGAAAVGTEDLKAVLELGARDAVRRLLNQERMPYRDIPQTTYSRLMASEAGKKPPAPSQARLGKGKARKDTAGRLEPREACEVLLYTLPAGLRETLLPFQRDGVLYGLRRRGRCLIADEMGTGKTLQALGVMGCYREDWPLLIVAPASMRLMWAEEVERWYPFLAPSEIHLIKGNKDKLYLTNVSRHLWPRVVVVSYFMLRMLSASVGKGDWKAVIFDESHMISTSLGGESAQSQQVTVCRQVAGRAKRVVMLSGTPSLSKPFDLFNQVEALSPGLLGRAPLLKAKQGFAASYCGATMRGQMSRSGHVNRVPFISGSEYPDELHLLLRNEVMIRRLKANVVKQLPPLRRIVVRVGESGEALKRALKEGGFEADAEVDDEEGGQGAAAGRDERGPGTGAGLMSKDHRAGLKKVKSASEWVIEKLIASEETLTKFVVFAHHKTVLDRLQEAFEVQGTRGSTCPFTPRAANDSDDASVGAFTCLRIDGSVPTALRASRLSEFNTNERCRVLVVSITAGGQGLDFTAASNVVFVELPESPAWLRQAEDRLHRRRQEKSVNVYLTVLPAGSHDDTRWLSLSEKLTTQTSVMNGTLDAENIDVDRVFDAGSTLDHDGPTRRPSRRRRRRAPTSLPTNNSAAGADEDAVGDGGCTGSLDDNEDSSASCIELSGSDDGSEDDDHDGGGVAEETETDLDAELRNALLSTPLDVPTHRPSQSPTFQLLRAIAESPVAPPSGSTPPKPNNIFSQAATSSSAKGKKKTSSSSPGARGNEGLARWLGREEGGAKTPRTGGGEGVGKGARKMTTMMSMDSPPGRGTYGAATASPVVSRKRPRSSPPGSGNAHGSPGNPFETYGHNCRPRRPPPLPPPPSPPSRLGVDSRSPPPMEVAPVGAGSDYDESDSNSSGASGQAEVGSQDPPPAAAAGGGASAQAESSPRRIAAGGAGSDLSQSGDDDSDFAVTPTPCRRGTRDGGGGGSGGTDRSGRPSPHHGDGSVCSPFVLVDLSQDAEQEGSAAAAAAAAAAATARVSGRTRGGRGGGGGGGGGDVEGGGGGGGVEEGERRGGGGGGGTPGRNTEVLPGALTEGEAAAGEGDGAPSPALSSDCLSPAGDRGSDAGQGRGGSEGVGGGDRGGEELLQLNATKRLYFLVSGNTGRVHVYKKVGGDDEDGKGSGGGGVGVEDDEEEARPQHCRCNFRPEDLDRLFEAAKEALLLSTATTTGPSTPTSRKLAAEACEAAAREALSTLPKLLWSAPALRVAREFVQEWRALSSRKRPLLKGTPCRPPLADELSRVTPALTGSKRRYAGTVGGRSTSGGPAGGGEGGGSAAVGEVNGGASGGGNGGGGGSGNAGSSAARSGGIASDKVMCLYCDEEAASEQGPPVHRRDRYCSVDCMEAHGTRTSNTSLRRLVFERDHGVCSGEGCGRDCFALVSRLKAVQHRQKRRDILMGADPRFGDERHLSLRERLVREPKGGYAWNADHVTAVYQGGGECGVDNLRTLCVLCHSEVTRVQTTERAATRRMEKEHKRRSLEEAQGQRRLVSFGGGIALSAGASQTGNTAGQRGGSQDDACEISGSDEDRGDTDGSSGGAHHTDSDDDDGVFMSPLKKQGRAGIAGRREGGGDDVAAKMNSTASKPGLKGCSLPHGGNEQPKSSAPRGEVDVADGTARNRHGVRSRSTRASLEAFERIINGEGCDLDSPPRAGGPGGRVPNAGAAVGNGGGGGGGGGNDSDDSCEIMFTRVRPT